MQQTTLDFSVMLFGASDAPTYKQYYEFTLRLAEMADKEGFENFWLPERHFSRLGQAFPNPALLHAALSQRTERIGLCAGSAVATLRDPLTIAEDWALINQLSGGRAKVAFASGWNPNDFVLAPDIYADRHVELASRIKQITALWEGQSLSRMNGVGEKVAVAAFPTPDSKIPIWITAARSPETFEMAGKIGANVLTHMLDQGLEQVAENIRVYRKARLENGFDEGHVTLMAHTFIGETSEEVANCAKPSFCHFLNTNFSLLNGLAKSRGHDFDVSSLDDASRQEFVEYIYDRFRTKRALIGTKDECRDLVEQIEMAGVDEVACLLDFGPALNTILHTFKNLSPFVIAEGKRRACDSTHKQQFNSDIEAIEATLKHYKQLNNLGENWQLETIDDWRIDTSKPFNIAKDMVVNELEVTPFQRRLSARAHPASVLTASIREMVLIDSTFQAQETPDDLGDFFQLSLSASVSLSQSGVAPSDCFVIHLGSEEHEGALVEYAQARVVNAEGSVLIKRNDRVLSQREFVTVLSQHRHIVVNAKAGPELAGQSSLLIEWLSALTTSLKQHASEKRLWLITDNLYAAHDDITAHLALASLWGAARTLRGEEPSIWAGSIDADTPLSKTLLERVLATSEQHAGKEWYVREQRLYHQVLKPAKSDAGQLSICADSTYLITGGSGDIGLTVANALLENGAGGVLLLARNSNQHTQALIHKANKEKTRVGFFAADVTAADGLQSLNAFRLQCGLPDIKGVIHAAGVFPTPTPMNEVSRDELQRVIAPKVEGLNNLISHFANGNLDFLIAFSSWSATLSALSGRLGSYGAANTAMDIVCQANTGPNIKKVLSIGWGDWGQTRVHKAARQAQSDLLPQAWQFSSTRGANALLQALKHFDKHVIFTPADWDEVNALMDQAECSVVLSALTSDRAMPSQLTRFNDSDQDLQTGLAELVRQRLKVKVSEQELVATGLQDLGFDSIMSFELRAKIIEKLGVELPIKLFISNQSINDLCARIECEEAEQDGSHGDEELIEVEL